MRRLAAVVLGCALWGCAGKLTYVHPVTEQGVTNSKIIDKPRDEVWNAAVPALGKQFFVINNLDRSSGLINLSYSGDPEAYVDCGRVVSYVKNLQGERTYDFPAAKGDENYEVMEGGLFSVHRKMSLEGRVNVVFEELGPSQTRVTVNTRYVLTRSADIQQVGGSRGHTDDTISFGSESGASFPVAKNGQATECRPTGKLERDILDLIK